VSQLLNTDAVQEAIGYPFTAKFLKDTLGVAPVKQEKRAMFWDRGQLPTICDRAAEFFSAQGDAIRKGGVTAKAAPASQAAIDFDDDDEEL